jgi:uncharacterized membrane protein
MDRESATLIKTLYSRSENFPKMMPVAMIGMISSLLLLFFLVKLWIPKKKKRITQNSSTDQPETVQQKESLAENKSQNGDSKEPEKKQAA